jgi:hypothetical protein
MTVDELGEHVNANPEIKKQAIEQEIELWAEMIKTLPFSLYR